MAPKRPLNSGGNGDGGHDSKRARKAGFRVGPDNLPDGPWRRKVTKIKNDLIQKAKLKKQYKKIKARELQKQPAGRSLHDATEVSERKEEEEADDVEPSADDNDDDDEQDVGAQPEGGSDDDDEVDQAARESPQKTAKKDSSKQHDKKQTKQNKDEQDDEQDKPAAEKQQQEDHIHPSRRGGGHGQSRNAAARPGYYDKALAEASRRRAEQEAREAEFARRRDERDRKNADRERFNRAMKKARTPGRDGQRKLGRESGLLLEKARRMAQQQ